MASPEAAAWLGVSPTERPARRGDRRRLGRYQLACCRSRARGWCGHRPGRPGRATAADPPTVRGDSRCRRASRSGVAPAGPTIGSAARLDVEPPAGPAGADDRRRSTEGARELEAADMPVGGCTTGFDGRTRVGGLPATGLADVLISIGAAAERRSSALTSGPGSAPAARGRAALPRLPPIDRRTALANGLAPLARCNVRPTATPSWRPTARIGAAPTDCPSGPMDWPPAPTDALSGEGAAGVLASDWAETRPTPGARSGSGAEESADRTLAVTIGSVADDSWENDRSICGASRLGGIATGELRPGVAGGGISGVRARVVPDGVSPSRNPASPEPVAGERDSAIGPDRPRPPPGAAPPRDPDSRAGPTSVLLLTVLVGTDAGRAQDRRSADDRLSTLRGSVGWATCRTAGGAALRCMAATCTVRRRASQPRPPAGPGMLLPGRSRWPRASAAARSRFTGPGRPGAAGAALLIPARGTAAERRISPSPVATPGGPAAPLPKGCRGPVEMCCAGTDLGEGASSLRPSWGRPL